MAPQSGPSPRTVSLRVITQLLAATPAARLPCAVPILANYLRENICLVSASELDSTTQEGSENAVLVHRFKAQVSTLLQHKTFEGTLGAIILAKAAVENGSLKFLQEAGPWIRSLLSILTVRPFYRIFSSRRDWLEKRIYYVHTDNANHNLQKPGGTILKQLCIITLTRIFLLSQRHPSIVREITTPVLPGFITSCLSISFSSKTRNRDCKQRIETPCLGMIVQSFIELIQLHPASFRPFSSQLQVLLIELLAPTNTAPALANQYTSISNSTCQHARHLFVLLHVCASKNNNGDAWVKATQDVLETLHRTTDLVLRALTEDITPSFRTRTVVAVNDESLSNEVADSETNPLSLPTWAGIHAGMERLNGLLQTLQAFISTNTSVHVNVPIGKVMHIVGRVLSANIPKNVRNGLCRPEISREECEGLYLGLPDLQVSAIKVLSDIITRFGVNLATVAPPIISMVSWVFENQQSHQGVRQASYGIVAQVLSLMGKNMPRHHMEGLSRLFQSCCDDLVIFKNQVKSETSGGSLSQLQAANYSSTSKDSVVYLKPTKNDTSNAKLHAAATRLLSVAIANLPDGFCHSHLRANIDRTSILAKTKQIMISSAMNPPMSQTKCTSISSILPLLVRQFPQSSEVEALIHPQMPVLQPLIDLVDISGEGSNVGQEAAESGPPQVRRNGVEGMNDIELADSLEFPKLEQHSESSALVAHGHAKSHDRPDSPTPSMPRLNILPSNETRVVRKRNRNNSAGTDPKSAASDENGFDESKRRRLVGSPAPSLDSIEDTEAPKAGLVVASSAQFLDEGNVNNAFVPVEGPDEPFVVPPIQDDASPRDLEEGSDESDFEIPKLDVGGAIEYDGEDDEENERSSEEDDRL